MKFNRIYHLILIVLIAYCGIMYLLPLPKDRFFWLPVSLTILAIISQFLFVYLTSNSRRSLYCKLYGVHIMILGLYYLIAQFILSTICIILRLPYWIPLAYSLFLVAATAIGALSAYSTEEILGRPQLSTTPPTERMNLLVNQTYRLIGICKDPAVVSELSIWLNVLNDSDPNSTKELRSFEHTLLQLLNKIEENILQENYLKPLPLLSRCHVLLERRNALLRTLDK